MKPIPIPMSHTAVVLVCLTGATSNLIAQSKTDDFKTRRSQWLQLCTADEETDNAERTALETYSSPPLEKALLSSKSFWDYLIDPSTPYMDRMAAANRGGSMLRPEELPLLWEAMAEIGSVPSDVSQTPCSAIAGLNSSRERESRVILGHKIAIPPNNLSFPVTAEERDHSPWLWQMERALSILFNRTIMYYGDVRYPVRVKAAWNWPITLPGRRPGDVVRDFNSVEWNRIYLRSRALTEGAPHDILLFQTIVRLALNNDKYYVAYSAPVSELWSWGPDHHLEELAQAAQVLILQETRWESVAAQAAFDATLSAQYKGNPESGPHAKLVKTATAVLAIGRWAMDKSLNPWNRYYSFVQPICKITEDAPCPTDQLRDPNDPRIAERLLIFETWFEEKKPVLEERSRSEQPHLQSLAKELQAPVD